MTDDPLDTTLRRLVGEAREDATPELDWDAMEASLAARTLEAKSNPVGRSNRRPWTAALALAALLGGALAFRFAVPHSRAGISTASHSGSAPSKSSNVDGDALATGAVVTSGGDPIVVEHVDHVTWTLSPGGAAHVESVGAVVGLSLDCGTISARVTKSIRPESFVIRVENSRIAVHGTAFRVERGASLVNIDVTEGVLAIGPVGGRAFELRAPGRAVLSFNGIRTDASGAVGPTGVLRPQPVSGSSAPLASAMPAGVARSPSEEVTRDGSGRTSLAAEDSPGVEHVIQAIRRCLADHTVADGDLHVTVRTRMSLRVQATGRVGEALFDPPLAPPVQECVDAKVGSIEFSASGGGFALDRVIELDH